jgi:hypothetical protein
MVIVEGKTEEIFIKRLVAPYLALKKIYMSATQISKPGSKGGDVKFIRVINDIEKHLKQRKDTFVSLFIDYYGLKTDWPGLKKANNCSIPQVISDTINKATREEVIESLSDYRAEYRFIPFVAVHEFEALLFSDPKILATHLHVKTAAIDEILNESGEPEAINNNHNTTPSKRLELLYNRYKKTSTGITIAQTIGIRKIRTQCPLFNSWLQRFEQLQNNTH